MWPLLMHCFGLSGQGTIKGWYQNTGGEKNLRIFCSTLQGKISAQHWQSTISCSGQACQKHVKCNQTVAFVFQLKDLTLAKHLNPT